MLTGDGYEEHEQFAGFVGIETACRNCKQLFLSRNKLHKHLKGGCSRRTKAVSKEVYPVTRSATRAAAPALSRAPTPTDAPTTPRDSCDAIPIVESTASKSAPGFGYAFRNWNYAMVSVALKSDFRSYDENLSEDHTKAPPPIDSNWINARNASSSGRNGCMDTGCGATLIDREWLKSQLPEAKILKMATPLKVRGMGTSKHKTDEYVLETLYFPAISNEGQQVVACIRRELHLVDNLRANILIGNDIIDAEGITIDIAKEKAYIPGCKATVPITAKQRG